MSNEQVIQLQTRLKELAKSFCGKSIPFGNESSICQFICVLERGHIGQCCVAKAIQK